MNRAEIYMAFLACTTDRIRLFFFFFSPLRPLPFFFFLDAAPLSFPSPTVYTFRFGSLGRFPFHGLELCFSSFVSFSDEETVEEERGWLESIPLRLDFLLSLLWWLPFLVSGDEEDGRRLFVSFSFSASFFTGFVFGNGKRSWERGKVTVFPLDAVPGFTKDAGGPREPRGFFSTVRVTGAGEDAMQDTGPATFFSAGVPPWEEEDEEATTVRVAPVRGARMGFWFRRAGDGGEGGGDGAAVHPPPAVAFLDVGPLVATTVFFPLSFLLSGRHSSWGGVGEAEGMAGDAFLVRPCSPFGEESADDIAEDEERKVEE